MEAKELRIGNKILNDGKIETVSEVSNADHVFTEESGFANIDKHIEPIPLTPEILEKAGFVWSIYHQATHKEGFPFDLNEINDLYGYTMYTFKRSTHITSCLKYLHQLQNLYFALTGEELKIEL